MRNHLRESSSLLSYWLGTTLNCPSLVIADKTAVVLTYMSLKREIQTKFLKNFTMYNNL